MKRIKIKPKSGLKIRDPFHADFLPDNGRDVQKNSYWIRRLKEGSVTLVEEAQPAKFGGGKK